LGVSKRKDAKAKDSHWFAELFVIASERLAEALAFFSCDCRRHCDCHTAMVGITSFQFSTLTALPATVGDCHVSQYSGLHGQS